MKHICAKMKESEKHYSQCVVQFNCVVWPVDSFIIAMILLQGYSRSYSCMTGQMALSRTCMCSSVSAGPIENKAHELCLVHNI